LELHVYLAGITAKCFVRRVWRCKNDARRSPSPCCTRLPHVRAQVVNNGFGCHFLRGTQGKQNFQIEASSAVISFQIQGAGCSDKRSLNQARSTTSQNAYELQCWVYTAIYSLSKGLFPLPGRYRGLGWKGETKVLASAIRAHPGGPSDFFWNVLIGMYVCRQ